MEKTIVEFLRDNFEGLDGVTDTTSEDGNAIDVWNYNEDKILFSLNRKVGRRNYQYVVTLWKEDNRSIKSTHEYNEDLTEEELVVIVKELSDETEMSFGRALEKLKNGKKLTRTGWNGENMFVVYQKGYPEGIPSNKQTADAWGHEEGDLFKVEPYLQIKTSKETHAMWVPSIGDILAEDWKVI